MDVAQAGRRRPTHVDRLVAALWSRTVPVSWIPLFSGLAGCLLGLVALGLALAHSLSVIAVAWVAHRPLLAGTLLAIVAGTLYALLRFLQRRRDARPGGTSSTSSSASYTAAD